MLNVEKPMIAAVNGAAVGLGATIALMCDVVIMAEDAKIGDGHVNVGLVAGDGGPMLFPLLIGPMRAKELLMTGRLLTGTEAAAAGLVEPGRARRPRQNDARGTGGRTGGAAPLRRTRDEVGGEPVHAVDDARGHRHRPRL